MSVPGKPVSVAVLVDLYFDSLAGGHVKAWERFAEATAMLDDPSIDLTVYFMGNAERVMPLSPRVRYRLLPPVLGTDRLRFVRQGGGHTDLAGFHRRLAACLIGHGVLHATSAFGFGRTAARVARERSKPLLYSLHTDAPNLARVYTRDAVTSLLGQRNPLTALLLDRLKVQEWSARAQQRGVERMIAASDRVIVSSPVDRCNARALVGEARVSMLRRGIDLERFNPARRDRGWLAQRYRIDPQLPVMLFAGRVDDSKRVMLAIEAAARVNADGRPVQLLLAGEGARTATARQRLGERVTLAGNLPQDQLARLMACADLFVFPSEIETFGNVVVEARASGLPVLVSARAASAQSIAHVGVDGVVIDHADDPAAWTAAIERLIDDPVARREMGARARRNVESRSPSWRDVVRDDLLPLWRDPTSLAGAATDAVATLDEIAA